MRSRDRLGTQEVAQSPVPLPRIAAPARRHYVTRTIVAAARLRLHVIHRQLLDGEFVATVRAAIPVALEDVLTLQCPILSRDDT